MRKFIPLLIVGFLGLASGFAQEPGFDFAHPTSVNPSLGFLGIYSGNEMRTEWATLYQEAPLTSPVSRTSEAKYKIRAFSVVNPPGGSAAASIDVSVQDSSNNEIRVASFQIPDPTHPAATVPALITAMMTVRATETGVDSRKMQFRVLGYFSDQGYFPPTSALVP